MKKLLAVAKYSISLVVAGLLLYFAFRNIDFAEFWERAALVDYSWVVYSILLSMVAYYARAYRWNILLKPLGHTNLNIHRTNLAILVGYLANLAFPRLGEVTRCGMLKRSDDVPVSNALGTVITERVIDLFTLIGLFLFALIAEYDRLITFFATTMGDYDVSQALIWKISLIAALGGIIALLVAYFAYLKFPKVKNFVNELFRGLLSLKDIKNPLGFVLSTVILWTTYYFMSYIIVFSIPETAHLSWMVGVMLLVTGGIALALPVQGGIGTYHAFISAMLVLYAVDDTTGVFLATLLHTSQVVAIALFGGLALIASLFIKKHEQSAENTHH
ncbi:lysylphosphatidylglycerol synthase transmembrane domain-containing protein [Marinoscillum furvescens]|uniref:Lysylphosphatidylglycerol synthase-like protein n=1 Tax=Marinoscillum furvescens DSM 4134 TaxID=1122208 RepID=A0A3D9LGW3_MARFU|nr:lysylphosphatidylglycerol synthase transmembrane domain-containing protein [Marinoscillum furvescens]REE05847.1 hypothetical protein C7460_101366 [Marinoscillum furvescens DSM 4134]